MGRGLTLLILQLNWGIVKSRLVTDLAVLCTVCFSSQNSKGWVLAALQLSQGQTSVPQGALQRSWGRPRSGHSGAWQLHAQVLQRSLTKEHQKPISFISFRAPSLLSWLPKLCWS